MVDPDLTGTTVYVMRALWEQRPLVEAASDQGAHVVAVDEQEDADGFEAADEHVVVSSLRDLDACLSVASDHDVDAVVTDQCDYSLFTTAYVGERLDLPAVDLATAQVTTNKRRMRDTIGSAAPQPEYRACATLAEARNAAAAVGTPCIVKPVDNRGGFGVSRVDEPDTLPDAFFDALANSHAREVLVERFVEGVPITVDGYHCGGRHRTLAVASKNTSMGSLHPNLSIRYPADIDGEAIRAAERVNDAVADALGVDQGATHAEYIYTGDSFYLLEFQNRGGGVYTSAEIVPAVTGFDVTRQLLADAVGQQTGQESRDYRMERAAVMEFLDFEPGTVSAIDGRSAVTDRDDVLALKLYFEVGDELEDFGAFTDSHGVLITTGETVSEARSAVEDALNSLELTYS